MFWPEHLEVWSCPRLGWELLRGRGWGLAGCLWSLRCALGSEDVQEAAGKSLVERLEPEIEFWTASPCSWHFKLQKQVSSLRERVI